MKYSGIGGQAVLEGIMMKNRERYAVAVRKPDGTIETKEDSYQSFADRHQWAGYPFIRGIFAFVDSLVLGIRTLMWSAELSEPAETDGKEKETEKESAGKKGGKEEKGLTKGDTFFAVFLAIVLAVGIFMVLPTVLINFLGRWIESETVLALLEGVLRVLIFIAYVAAVSCMKDIRRTYMYHGSEHKCINCIEHGLPLTVENVMKSSKEHKRCGTSFLLIVMLISILVFMVVRVKVLPLKILSRILLVPVIAGISYEVLRLTGRFDNKFVNIISRPGMWMQALTTKEPTEDMVEVAIAAVEKVFDWQQFLKDNFEA